jgi:glycerol-3-phosphate dehydrogenase (NAD(P)+)
MTAPQRISIIGAGAWGTSLAIVLRRAKREVLMWARTPDVAKTIRSRHENPLYLPGQRLDRAIQATADLYEAAQCEAALLVTPAQHLRAVATELARHLPKATPVVICAKGIEQETGLLMTEVIAATLPGRPMAVLSGPTFAAEVARGLPCALTLAARDAAFARDSAALLHGGRIRVYYSVDLVGVEIGGAVKNVMAIAAGISDGLGLGLNARAALITRGLAEIARLGASFGGSPETFFGLAGAGDLILTATGDLSRNRQVGLELARGRSLAEILAGLGHVAEGARSAKEVARIAAARGVDMPVTDAVNAVLEGKLTPARAVELLLSRDPKKER